MKLSRIGERGLLKKIKRWCSNKSGSPFFTEAVPLGDDCYAAKLSSSSPLLFTTDTLLEGTHFKFEWLEQTYTPQEAWKALGCKAMAVNLSDLASMGAITPLFAFVTLGLSGDISVDSVDNLYRGMNQVGKKEGVSIVGGDIIRSEKSIISLTLVGQTKKGHPPLTRSGAKVGDILCVTGCLGHSLAGLLLLKEGQGKTLKPSLQKLIQSHLTPKAKLKEGALLANHCATSCIDTSDDLLTSLEILRQKSGVGFDLQIKPSQFSKSLLYGAQQLHKNPFRLFLSGGEDYQLLFTCPPQKIMELKTKIPSTLAIGTVRPYSYGIRHSGKKVQPNFKHF